ncbi:MAG: acyl-CoA dehydrogenase family protein [Myxococcota bacterium]|jgi:glutaryl-CoA dehydrogenase|nr:acyl-CoA dehydrogenase family protein [Myxococcota bacterium]
MRRSIPPFDDFLDLSELLEEHQRSIRDAARQWVEKRVRPTIAHHFEEGSFPVELIREMGSMGFFGPSLPEEYGGAGLDAISYGLILQELERGDSGMRSFSSVQSSLVMYPIFSYGSEQQRQRWLPRLARGQAVGCFGLTEPDHGSDPGGMQTSALPLPGGGWRLNGRKMWITNGSIADVAVVWAKSPDGIRAFLVEKGTPGFLAQTMAHKLSLRASITSELLLDDCELGEEARLPEAMGLGAALSCLNKARYGIAWGALGAATDCLACAVEHQKNRWQFGRPLASFQLQQARMAEMVSRLSQAQLLMWRLGQLEAQGRLHHTQVSLAKRNNVQAALEIARESRQMLGASGITSELSVMRHMLNLESVSTYEGTHDIHTLVLGEALTGMSAFR